jgi:hypothetical protein
MKWRFALVMLLSWSCLCEAKKPAVQDPAALAPTHGLVFANLPKGGVEILQVAPVAGGKEIALDLTQRPGGSYQSRWLPEGDYRITKWGLSTWSPPQPFHVQAGRVTDLGSLLAIGLGGYTRVYVSLRPDEERAAIEPVLRQLDSVLQVKEPIRWQQPTPSAPSALVFPGSGMGLIPDLLLNASYRNAMPPQVRALLDAKSPEEFLGRAREITLPMYEEAAIDRDGKTYFGADLGRIRVRDPDGHWSSIGMDTLHTIPAVEWVDGVLVAGSDDGVIRRSQDGGATWSGLRRIAGDAVIDIDHQDGAWLVTTSHVIPQPNGMFFLDRLSVHRATRPDLSDLERLRDFPIDAKAKDLVGWIGAQPQVHGQWFMINTGKLQRLDLSTLAWKELAVPSRISRFNIDPDSGLVSATFAMGAFSKIHVSEDNGETWTQIGRPPYAIFDVQMQGRDQGYAVRLNADAVKTRWQVYAFDAGINDWRMASEAPSNCKPLRANMSQPILCLRGDGSIRRLDAGKWVSEVDTQIDEAAGSR